MIALRLRSWLLAAALASVATAAPARAEVPAAPRRGAPVSVAGAPRTLVTLAVAAPAEFEDASDLRFEVQISGAVDVLGRLEGQLERLENGRMRPVMLTLRVPGNALVGLLDVADVVFVTSDGRSIAVPIILRVPAVQYVRLIGPRDMSDLRRGDRVSLSYRVQNLGNVTEMLAVHLEPPAGWTARVRGGERVTVPAYGSADVTVDLRVATMPTSGSLALDLALRPALVADSTVATARTGLRLAEVAATLPGLRITPFVGAATSGDGGAVSSGLRAVGPLLDNVWMSAEFAPTPNVRGLSAFGLSSVGALGIPFNASLVGPQWRAGVGTVSGSVGELTGLGFAGRGGAFSWHRDSTELTLTAARPGNGNSGGGSYLGARASWEQGPGRLSASASWLEEAALGGLPRGRALRAVGADYELPLRNGTTVGAGTAVREYGEGPALGLRGYVARDGRDGRVALRASYAPGGSAAFASATSTLQADGRRSIGDRLVVDAAVQRSQDRGILLNDVRTSSGSASARYQLVDWAALRLTSTYDRAEVRGAAPIRTGFGSAQASLAGGVDGSLGAWIVSGEVRGSRLERSTLLFSGNRNVRAALQQAVTVSASRPTQEWGTFAVGTTLARTGAGVGVPGDAITGFARLGGLPMAIAGQLLLFDNEVRAQRSSVDRLRLSYRGGLTARLRSGLEIGASVERDPFLRDLRGRVGWIAALRIGLSTEVLTSARFERAGTVFRDDNANGQHDEGEPGLGGVTLLYDNIRFRTNREGTFRVPGSIRGRLEVDPRTIPSGLVVHPRVALDTLERREIALVPTGSVVLALELVIDAEGRVPAVDLAAADVWLRDSEGYEWVGRSEGDGRFVFEHVPVGQYVLRTSFTRLSEPVRADDVKLMVLPGANAAVQVPVRGRNVRIITPPRQGEGRGAAPRFTPRNGQRFQPRQ